MCTAAPKMVDPLRYVLVLLLHESEAFADRDFSASRSTRQARAAAPKLKARSTIMKDPMVR